MKIDKEKLIFEIGDIISVRKSLLGRKLSAREIMDSHEYKKFRKKYPYICEIAERGS